MGKPKTLNPVDEFLGWPAKLAACPQDERKAVYAEYLESTVWRGKRTATLERAGNRCQVCNSAKHLQVHHRTYERVGDEAPGDLTVLCRTCHAKFHAVGKTKQIKPQRQRKAKRRTYIPKQPCSVCGRNWTTKGVCKPCKRRRKRGLPPLKSEVTQEDVDRYADALSRKWQPTGYTKGAVLHSGRETWVRAYPLGW